MMTLKQKFTLAFVSFLVPATVIAAAPGNVKTVQASVQNGSLTVTWSAVPDASLYRVYYSHESILGNQGNYDDFIATTGPVNSYTFASLPLQSSRIFLGVLAVDASGVESEGFETETSVDIPAMSAPSVSSAQSSLQSSVPASASSSMPGGENPTSTAKPMSVVSVQAVSETGVLVTFTKNVKVVDGVDTTSFLMTTASGVLLPIVKVGVNGTGVLLTTEKQGVDTEYIFSLLKVVPADDGTNATPNASEMRFPSFVHTTQSSSSFAVSSSYGRNPNIPGGQTSSSEASVTAPANPPYLSLAASPRSDGAYNVIAQWGDAYNADSYSLYTSREQAQFLLSETVDKDRTNAEFDRISPGRFSVKVTSKNAAGESSGIEKSIDLPSTGAGLLGIAAAAGALATRRMKRRKIVS